MQVLKLDKETWLKQMRQKPYTCLFVYWGKWSNVIYLFGQKYMNLQDHQFNSFEGEIRVGCFNQWGDNQVWDWEAQPYLKKRNLRLHYQSVSFTKQVCGSVSWLKQRRFLRTLEEDFLMLTRLERVTKPFLKSLDSTSRLSGRLCINGRHPTLLLPSPGVVKQQRPHQEQGM